MSIDDACFRPDASPARDHDLHEALLDSRQRWRDFVALAADLAFETDRDGRLTFIAPESVLGRDAACLLGCFPATLLGERDAALPAAGPLPPMRQRPIWMRHADGSMRCMALTVVPRLEHVRF